MTYYIAEIQNEGKQYGKYLTGNGRGSIWFSADLDEAYRYKSIEHLYSDLTEGDKIKLLTFIEIPSIDDD